LANDNNKPLMGTAAASGRMGPICGDPNEVISGIATRAVHVEVFEELAHVRGAVKPCGQGMAEVSDAKSIFGQRPLLLLQLLQ
jgi:hypothetical protein